MKKIPNYNHIKDNAFFFNKKVMKNNTLDIKKYLLLP